MRVAGTELDLAPQPVLLARLYIDYMFILDCAFVP